MQSSSARSAAMRLFLLAWATAAVILLSSPTTDGWVRQSMLPDRSRPRAPPLSAFERMTAKERVEFCDREFPELFKGIYADLERWRAPRISLRVSSVKGRVAGSSGH